MPLLPPTPDPILTPVEAARRAVAEQFDRLATSLKSQSAKNRADLIHRLAQDFRRLRTFETERDWIAAVLDASAPFAFRAVFFGVLGGKLEWKAARNVEVPPGAALPLPDAPAFAAAAESGEITVAMKTAGELSRALVKTLGEEPDEKVALVPIVANRRTMAVLYAEDADTAGLELVAAMAGSALEAHQLKSRSSTEIGLLQIAPASSGVSADDDEWRLRAQRFARLRTSEIRLYDSAKVQEGRRDRNLYGALRHRIDEAREAYRNQFPPDPSTTVDYLDQEFIRTLAQGDRELMGPDYPGPLV
jgi:hypothetical protein